jgi:ribose-phosphate pyrophosphokinase
MIRIFNGAREVSLERFTFPGGELSVKINPDCYNFQDKSDWVIDFRPLAASEVFELALVKNALMNLVNRESSISLFMPYIPYARQDRICNCGEAFSLKVFAKFVNDLGFKNVTVVDPHSDVSAALFDNIQVIAQLHIFEQWRLLKDVAKNCILLSPDVGANKKTFELAKFLGHENFVRADKLRDMATGNIKETIVYCDDFKGKDVFVGDDVLDGGRSFTELAKVCKSKNCGKFILYTTHGIFSKGIDSVITAGIDEIWTTDSFKATSHEKVKSWYLTHETFN